MMEINGGNKPDATHGKSGIDIRQVERKERGPAARRAAQAEVDDTLHLSFDSGKLEALRKIVAQAPEIRQEKVASLKQALASGALKLNAEAVAEKILQESLA